MDCLVWNIAFLDFEHLANVSPEDGNMGVIQTMVGELVHKPEHERKSEPLHSINRRS